MNGRVNSGQWMADELTLIWETNLSQERPGPKLGFLSRGGTAASSEDTSPLGGSGGILPQEMFKFGGSETLF